MRYPVEFVAEDNGTVTVYLPDIPGCHTFGDDQSDALVRAVDAAEAMLSAIIADGEDIPAPSDKAGRATIAIPVASGAKLALYQAMREAKVDKAELARRLGWREPQVDRLLDLNQAAELDQIEAALQALGKEIEIRVLDAA